MRTREQPVVTWADAALEVWASPAAAVFSLVAAGIIAALVFAVKFAKARLEPNNAR